MSDILIESVAVKSIDFQNQKQIALPGSKLVLDHTSNSTFIESARIKECVQV
jgi:hypothetical protein